MSQSHSLDDIIQNMIETLDKEAADKALSETDRYALTRAFLHDSYGWEDYGDQHFSQSVARLFGTGIELDATMAKKMAETYTGITYPVTRRPNPLKFRTSYKGKR